MRQQSIWSLLVVSILTIGVLLLPKYLAGSQTQHPPQAFSTGVSLISKTAQIGLRQITPAVKAPIVDANQLLTHLRALAVERYTDSQRAQARTYLLKTLTEFGWQPVLQVFSRGVNVFAERPGTDPQAGSILVAAHYDTVRASPGADDNASGTAVVLEVARLLGRLPTRRTLQVILFDREEQGLLGSRAAAANPSFTGNLKGVIVMDMVGYACHQSGCQQYPEGLLTQPPTQKGDFVVVASDQDHRFLLDAFQTGAKVQPLKSILPGQYQPSRQRLPGVLSLSLPLQGILTPDLLRSDHAPFWLRGIGAVLVTDTANFRTPHYHQASDQVRTIDRSFLTGTAQLVVNATATLLTSDDEAGT